MDGPLRDEKKRGMEMKRKTINLNGGEKGPVCLMSVDTIKDINKARSLFEKSKKDYSKNFSVKVSRESAFRLCASIANRTLMLLKKRGKARTSEASKAIFLDEARALMDLYSTFYSLAVFGENRDIFEIKFNVNVFEDFMKNIQAEDGLHE